MGSSEESEASPPSSTIPQPQPHPQPHPRPHPHPHPQPQPQPQTTTTTTTVWFLPGPVGLQLTPDPIWGSRVARFIDGGPQRPGPARASGRILPGDWILQVESYHQGSVVAAAAAAAGVATDYHGILQLLQQSHLTRKLTVRSFAHHYLLQQQQHEQQHEQQYEPQHEQQHTRENTQNTPYERDPGALFAIANKNDVEKDSILATFGIPVDDDSSSQSEESYISTFTATTNMELYSQHHHQPQQHQGNRLPLLPSIVQGVSEIPTNPLLANGLIPLPHRQQFSFHDDDDDDDDNNDDGVITEAPLARGCFGTQFASVDQYPMPLEPLRLELVLILGQERLSGRGVVGLEEDNTEEEEDPSTVDASNNHPRFVCLGGSSTGSDSFPGQISLTSVFGCDDDDGDFTAVVRRKNCLSTCFGTTLSTEPTTIYLDETLLPTGFISSATSLSDRRSEPKDSSLTATIVLPLSVTRDHVWNKETFVSESFSGRIVLKSCVHESEASNCPSSFSTVLEEASHYQPHLDECLSGLYLATTTTTTSSSTNSSATSSSDVIGDGQGTAAPSSGSLQPRRLFHTEETTDDTQSKLENVAPIQGLEASLPISQQHDSATNLLQKARAKHQLSLARLRIQKQYKKAVQPTEERSLDISEELQKSASASAFTESKPPIDNFISLPDVSILTQEDAKLSAEHTHDSTPSDKGLEPAHKKQDESPASVVIDFAQFSREQVVLFAPGPVGIQLEQQQGDYPVRIVRFVDGGPNNPGQARGSGQLRPGDFVVRVEAEGIVGTTYFTILHLLQKTWATRKLTFRSAWDPTIFGTSERRSAKQMSPKESANGPSSERAHSISAVPPRKSPLKAQSPHPHEWTPLPFDWVYRTHRANTKTEEGHLALQGNYQEEAARLFQERQQKLQQKEQQRARGDHQRRQHQWNFEGVLLGAVAVAAESFVGCLRKERVCDAEDSSLDGNDSANGEPFHHEKAE